MTHQMNHQRSRPVEWMLLLEVGLGEDDDRDSGASPFGAERLAGGVLGAGFEQSGVFLVGDVPFQAASDVAVGESLGIEIAQILDTSDLEIPVSAPNALTRSSTFLVDTPCR